MNAMNKLPQIKPQDLEKVLIKCGFVPKSGKGSHIVFTHADGRRIVVPAHNRPVRIGTLRAIVKQSHLTVDELLELRR